MDIYQVDAFTDSLFKGNPAAVCLFEKWPEDELMQNIAAENNLAETAFLVKNGSNYNIRWFTPTIEVDLCGHATLASGFVVFNILNHSGNEVTFHSINSGDLKVTNQNGILTLDFPADKNLKEISNKEVITSLGLKNTYTVLKGKTDLMVVLENENEVLSVTPDMKMLSALDARGIIITAPGMNTDFVSRFFGPAVGVPEDPVTGSAHTTLIPYWANRLGKEVLIARQLSKRGGLLYCGLKGDRVTIGGNARLYLKGEIFLK